MCSICVCVCVGGGGGGGGGGGVRSILSYSLLGATLLSKEIDM